MTVLSLYNKDIMFVWNFGKI